MNSSDTILCIGSVLWDIIGRSPSHMKLGADVPGRITRIPGGVAMNIAMTLRRFGLKPEVLTSIGKDVQGDELVARCHALGVGTTYAYRSEDLPTDWYMAVEGGNGLIAAIADAHSLEAAGAKILRPMRDGRLGDPENPYRGVIAIDGNLTESLLAEITEDPAFGRADLRIAPASPGKAERLRPFIGHPTATLYVNCEEAGLICHDQFTTAPDAARGLRGIGVARALVTNGGEAAAMTNGTEEIVAMPPKVLVTRVTGAGDTFMAAHIASEMGGANEAEALSRALNAAAAYVSGDAGL